MAQVLSPLKNAEPEKSEPFFQELQPEPCLSLRTAQKHLRSLSFSQRKSEPKTQEPLLMQPNRAWAILKVEANLADLPRRRSRASWLTAISLFTWQVHLLLAPDLLTQSGISLRSHLIVHLECTCGICAVFTSDPH